MRFAIAQCETVTISDIGEYVEKFLESLEKKRMETGADWMFLMITDILKKDSLLLCTEHKLEKKLPYEKMGKGLYFLPQIMSRKKQLLPDILHIVE